MQHNNNNKPRNLGGGGGEVENRLFSHNFYTSLNDLQWFDNQFLALVLCKLNKRIKLWRSLAILTNGNLSMRIVENGVENEMRRSLPAPFILISLSAMDWT